MSSNYLNDDGTLNIQTWATSMLPNLAEALVPMYGTAAVARPLVSNGELGLDLVRVAPGRGFEPHTHPGDHLLIIVEGRGTITYDGSIYPTRAGEVYLIEGSKPHAVGAISQHSILAVGSPHRPAGGADRMVLTEYDAIAADLGVINCLICERAGTADELRDGGCVHAPDTAEQRTPVLDGDERVAVAGDVALHFDALEPHGVEVTGGVLHVTVGFTGGEAVAAMACTLAAAGPIRGDEFTDEDVSLAREALARFLTS